jgi:hypothetical protein
MVEHQPTEGVNSRFRNMNAHETSNKSPFAPAGAQAQGLPMTRSKISSSASSADVQSPLCTGDT